MGLRCRVEYAGSGRRRTIETAKLNEIDPQAWLARVLDRIPGYKINRIDELLTWNCSTEADPRPIS